MPFDWFKSTEGKWAHNYYFGEIYTRALEIAVIKPYNKILGIASGRAFVEDYISKVCRLVIATDVNRFLMRKSKTVVNNLNNFVVCDAFNLPFKKNTFECSYSQGFMEHYDVCEIYLLLDEILEVCQAAIFSAPLEGFSGTKFGIEYHRTLSEWEEILSEYKYMKSGYYDEVLGSTGLFYVSNIRKPSMWYQNKYLGGIIK